MCWNLQKGGNAMNMEQCHRCGVLDELIACIHFDTGEVLGELCKGCIEDYLQHLHAIGINLGDDE